MSGVPDFGDIENSTYEDPNDCTPEHFAIPILYTIIATVGIIANCVVIFIITVLKEYEKSVTNIYILQLAIADFIFLFQVFFQARTMLLGRWTYGIAWCKISEAIKMLNYYSSIAFLAVLSVDRYMTINLAMNQKVRKFRTRKAACIVSGCTWLISFLSVINILTYATVHECDCTIAFPGKTFEDMFPVYNYDDFPGNDLSTSGLGSDDYSNYTLDDWFSDYELMDTDGNISCSLGGDHVSQVWLVSNFLLAFVIPLIIICVSYALILHRIMKPRTIGSKSKSNDTRKRVTRMVSGLVSTFVICWLPYHSFNLARLNGIQLHASTCYAVTNFTIVLAYSNSAINPFFYTFLASNFRKRWGTAVGNARRGLRQSILSHGGNYTPGTSFRVRRKSSLSNSTAKNRDDISVSSFATKNTIVPINNTEIKEDRL